MRALLVTAAAGVLLAGCAGPTPPEPAAAGFGHVHGVDVDPADGTVYAATHHGVFRLGPAGPERIGDRRQDTMGFTIAGPGRFLASGHPDPREGGPAHLGFLVSEDRAATWTAVALRGEADFHALSAAGPTVYGFDSTDGVVMRSDDGGRTWQTGARLRAADLDVDPADPRRVLATTAEGLQESVDGGLGFTAVDGQPPQPLLLLDHVERPGSPPALVGVDVAGGVWSTAGSWTRVGELPGSPEAFTAVTPDRYLAATAQGVVESVDGGRTWTLLAGTGA